MSEKSQETIWSEWRELVTMAPQVLDDWLQTDESRSVGADSGDGESTGHKSGRRIVELLRTNRPDLNEADYEHMAKVVGYIKRHLAQGGPDEDKEHSAWRYSLMNWGHDPLD